jgi:hypothetical protein
MASRKISVPHGNCTPAVQPEANNFTELSRLSHATKKHGKSNATRKFHGSTATVNIRSYYLSGSFQYLPLFPLFLPTLILRFQIYIPLERRFDPWSPPSAGHNDCLHHWIVIRFLYFSKWQAGWAKDSPPFLYLLRATRTRIHLACRFSFVRQNLSPPSNTRVFNRHPRGQLKKSQQTARKCSISKLHKDQ